MSLLFCVILLLAEFDTAMLVYNAYGTSSRRGPHVNDPRVKLLELSVATWMLKRAGIIPGSSIANPTRYVPASWTYLCRKTKSSNSSIVVDDYQGGQSDYVLLDLVVSDALRFVKDKHRMNVALTRAKYGLVLIGDSDSMVMGESKRLAIGES
ncbi:MAG: hypothetical protein M1816_008021 [Peltula sp. TS41687]|nr:MAG: hypothetical protein M1816_008021 [Peltula sp. TS41687]